MNRSRLTSICVIAAVCSGSFAASAAEAPASQVKRTYCASPASVNPEPRECGIGDYLVVEVTDLKLVQASAPKDKRLVLFLNCFPLKGVSGEKCSADGNALRFLLARRDDKDNRTLWSRILGRPGSRTSSVSVSLGFDDGTIVADGDDSTTVRFPLLSHSPKKALVLFGAIVLLLALLLVAGKRSAMLRDPFPAAGEALAPYSLARTQMAWWFFNIAAAFLLIWGTTGAFDTITPQLLVLMGISAGTALASAAVDSSKHSETQQAQQKALETAQEANHLLATAPTDALLQRRATQAKNDLAALDQALKGPSASGFLSDLLTDVNGYSLHRLQVMVWTILLTIIFWASVWTDLAMPQFSETLLGLMGISSGTYLGFKLPEKQM